MGFIRVVAGNMALALCCLALASQGTVAQPVTEMASGEILKVNKDASKLTIRHGEIKSLDMPPMTMVFNVKKAEMLDQVKPGEKIRFTVVREDGKMVVTDIQPAP